MSSTNEIPVEDSIMKELLCNAVRDGILHSLNNREPIFNPPIMLNGNPISDEFSPGNWKTHQEAVFAFILDKKIPEKLIMKWLSQYLDIYLEMHDRNSEACEHSSWTQMKTAHQIDFAKRAPSYKEISMKVVTTPNVRESITFGGDSRIVEVHIGLSELTEITKDPTAKKACEILADAAMVFATIIDNHRNSKEESPNANT